jgi:hypothetical protein
MKKTIILKEETTMDEVFMSQIIEEPNWHREGVGNGLLAEQKSWQSIESEVKES